MSLTDQQKRKFVEMSIGDFTEQYYNLADSEKSAVFAYLCDEHDARRTAMKNRGGLSSLSSSEQDKLFDLSERFFMKMARDNPGPFGCLWLMMQLLKKRGWSPEKTGPAKMMERHRTYCMGSLRQDLARMEENVGHTDASDGAGWALAGVLNLKDGLQEYLAWHKADIAAKGEQVKGEKQDLEEIDRYLTSYYEAAWLRAKQAYNLNDIAKDILTDYDKPDAMQRRTMDSPVKLFGKLSNLSPRELDTLCDDARHNLEISLMDMAKAEQRREKSSLPLYNFFNDGERAFFLGFKGKKSDISARGLTMMCNACKEGKKDTLYGDLDFTIRGMKKDLADAKEELKNASVGASAFVTLLGFALAALMMFVPPVQAFFEGPFFSEPNMVLLAIILIAIGVVTLGVGGIPLCALAVVAYLGLTYFLFEVVGFGVILMGIITIAGLVFGVGGLVSMIKDAKTLSDHKRRGPAVQAKVSRRAGECQRYIDYLTDILTQYRAAAEKRPSSDQKKRDLEDLDRLLAYYDMARKQVQELGVEDDDDDDLGF